MMSGGNGWGWGMGGFGGGWGMGGVGGIGMLLVVLVVVGIAVVVFRRPNS